MKPQSDKNHNLENLIRAEINEADPIGLLSIGAPKDEYGLEVKEIGKKIGLVKNKKEIEDLIYTIFVKMFGSKIAGEKEKYATLAANIFRKIKT